MVMILTTRGRHNGEALGTVARHPLGTGDSLPSRYRKRLNEPLKVRRDTPLNKAGLPRKKTGPKPEKVNADIVKLIRRDYAGGEMTIAQISKRYCISVPYAGAIIKRTKWQHV